MDLMLNAADLTNLSGMQKNAILQALFLALGIDREVNAEELAQFEREVASIPWGIDHALLQEMVRAARVRRKLVSGAHDTQVWIREIASYLPSQSVKEKTLAAMGRIALAQGINRAERGLLNAFASSLELPADRLEQIKQALSPASASPTQGAD